MNPLRRPIVSLAWLALLILIVLVYKPGLHGDYVFDDLPNIVKNPRLRLDILSYDQMRGAALSGEAGPLGRPVSMLSFALNYHATGLDPYFFKVTNLIIHIANALLVGFLAKRISLQLREANEGKTSGEIWTGWIAAAMWGLHPLNLTGVLYVVQRMTSLSTFFGLAALLAYVAYRQKWEVAKSTPGWKVNTLSIVGLLLLLGLSVFSKESGLLFLPLLLWIEYLIFDFRLHGRPIQRRKISLKLGVGYIVGAIALFAAIFVVPKMVGPAAYAARDFTLIERVLTESRVLFLYLKLIVLPRSSELSLYHDDIAISTGVFEPVSTALSLVGLVAITVLALSQRKKHPLITFAWGWFLISHSLESTVFSLELVHEHRNYLASIGFAIASATFLNKWIVKRSYIAIGALAIYLSLLSIITWTRALQWSNPVDQALIEAANHPNSARANYNLGRVYLRLLDETKEERFGPLADQAFHASLNSANPGVGPYFALLHLAYYQNRRPSQQLIKELEHQLNVLPFYAENVAFLKAFMECQIASQCHMPDLEAVGIFVAALENARGNSFVLSETNKLLAQYFINRFKDLDKGIEFIGDALAQRDDASTRIMLAQAYRLKGEHGAAAQQLQLASVLDRRGVYKNEIGRERIAETEPSVRP